MSVLPTNRKTIAVKTGWYTSLQRWRTWCLLLFYGFPACLGPHWHHHDHEHDHHIPSSSCQSDLQGAPKCVQVCSECECCAEPTSCVSANRCRSVASALLDGYRLLHIRHSCAICAYYAQAIVLAGESSLASSIASQDFISRASESPWIRSILRANSRGPPAATLLSESPGGHLTIADGLPLSNAKSH